MNHEYLSPIFTRVRSKELTQLVLKNQSKFFTLDSSKKEEALEFLEKVILSRFQKDKIAKHGRRQHLSSKNRNYFEKVENICQKAGCTFAVENKLELLLLSCFLDAGAGQNWKYNDSYFNCQLVGSEALAAASTDLYLKLISDNLISKKNISLTSDALKNMKFDEFSKSFQHDESNNALLGAKGRYDSLTQLGSCLELHPSIFVTSHKPELKNIYHFFQSIVEHKSLNLEEVFKTIVFIFHDFFTSDTKINEINLCDSRIHSNLISLPLVGKKIPFFKLIQWMVYSIDDFFNSQGIPTINEEFLSGLAEYRNGGFFMDTNIINLKSKNLSHQSYSIDSELVTEWRALTITLLDEFLEELKIKRGYNHLNMSKLLEGGTWIAGRKLARENRPDSPYSPPIKIITDGKFF